MEGASPVAFKLHGVTARLLVLQDLRVVDGHNETLGYQYRFSGGEEKGSWMLRWEYFRERPRPDYAYPSSHVHVNGQLASGGAVTLPKLHIPTRRVPLEMILWHLIVEWGVKPKQGDWQHLLEASIEDFERRRRAP